MILYFNGNILAWTALVSKSFQTISDCQMNEKLDVLLSRSLQIKNVIFIYSSLICRLSFLQRPCKYTANIDWKPLIGHLHACMHLWLNVQDSIVLYIHSIVKSFYWTASNYETSLFYFTYFLQFYKKWTVYTHFLCYKVK